MDGLIVDWVLGAFCAVCNEDVGSYVLLIAEASGDAVGVAYGLLRSEWVIARRQYSY